MANICILEHFFCLFNKIFHIKSQQNLTIRACILCIVGFQSAPIQVDENLIADDEPVSAPNFIHKNCHFVPNMSFIILHESQRLPHSYSVYDYMFASWFCEPAESSLRYDNPIWFYLLKLLVWVFLWISFWATCMNARCQWARWHIHKIRHITTITYTFHLYSVLKMAFDEYISEDRKI